MKGAADGAVIGAVDAVAKAAGIGDKASTKTKSSNSAGSDSKSKPSNSKNKASTNKKSGKS